MIPRILHQTWKSRRVPAGLRRFVASWQKHCQLDYRFYTDEDLRHLIAQHFPQHLALYDGFDRGLERADFARYAMMFVYGGIYADLDMECLRPIEPLLDAAGPILGTEPQEHIKLYRAETLLCNAILLSPAGDPLWSELLNYIAKIYRHGGNVIYNTGPMALTTFWQQRPELFQHVRITSPNLFYPLIDPRFGGKRQGRFSNVSQECDINAAYTAHHWSHCYDTWPNQLRENLSAWLRGRKKHFHETPEKSYDLRYYRGPLSETESRRELIATFAEYTKVMRHYRIDSWLMYGSLLGWYRNQGIIPWDNDVDMGVHYNDLFLMRQFDYSHPRYVLEVNPNHVVRNYQPKNKVDARFIDRETGIFIDVFGYDRDDDETYVIDKQRNKYLKSDIYPVAPCEFEGASTLRPHNPLGVLHAYYGDCLEHDHNWNGTTWEKVKRLRRHTKRQLQSTSS